MYNTTYPSNAQNIINIFSKKLLVHKENTKDH